MAATNDQAVAKSFKNFYATHSDPAKRSEEMLTLIVGMALSHASPTDVFTEDDCEKMITQLQELEVSHALFELLKKGQVVPSLLDGELAWKAANAFKDF